MIDGMELVNVIEHKLRKWVPSLLSEGVGARVKFMISDMLTGPLNPGELSRVVGAWLTNRYPNWSFESQVYRPYWGGATIVELGLVCAKGQERLYSPDTPFQRACYNPEYDEPREEPSLLADPRRLIR